MILNDKAVIELLVDGAAHIGFHRYTICKLHAILADNLLADLQAGGRVREISLPNGGTVFHPLEGAQAVAVWKAGWRQGVPRECRWRGQYISPGEPDRAQSQARAALSRPSA